MSEQLDCQEQQLKYLKESLYQKEERKKSLKRELQSINYRNHCYEIDENLWKAAMTLEQKGYHLGKNAWSDLEHSWCYDIQIEFEQNYWFDFSSFPSKKGWSYDRERKRMLFLLSKVPVKYREKQQMTEEQYLDWQREALVQWTEQLPEARALNTEEEIIGLTKDGSFRQNK